MLSQAELHKAYDAVRGQTERLCEPLEREDYVLQAMENTSPPLWHLAHTTWFFEQFILTRFVEDYTPHRSGYAYLFNSYYVGAGPRHERSRRGLISRPTLPEVLRFREVIDERMHALLEAAGDEQREELAFLLTLGLNHEQQHQELLLTDIKYNLFQNPLFPAYDKSLEPGAKRNAEDDWLGFTGGLLKIGHQGAGFHFDNETPRHKAYLQPFQLRNTLVTNGEYLAFVEDGGYDRTELWLSDGWAARVQEDWRAPLYWILEGGTWYNYTLGGLRELNRDEPVCHVSHYEADAFAEWAGARLATEFEWEHAGTRMQAEKTVANNASGGLLHPAPARQVQEEKADGESLLQMFGDTWEWTRSAYLPYPGYRPHPGTIGEYNGKFMANQMVLRGGSAVTPTGHTRPTYRNFFHSDSRWQFSGIRLARDSES